MICLGCGQPCVCPEPALYPTWPLEANFTNDELRAIVTVLRQGLAVDYRFRPRYRRGDIGLGPLRTANPAVIDLVNLLENYLERTDGFFADLIIREFTYLMLNQETI
jgi:hypothetical protein